jgi:hypothetical protein
MSYMIDKFNNGEVKMQNGAAGWLFDSGEFRPLMADAMAELLEAGLVDIQTVEITAVAREASLKVVFAEYRTAQANRSPEQVAEERMMAAGAMGPGVDMVNVFTGETYTT